MATTYDAWMAESGRQSELDAQRRNFTYDQAKSQWEQSGGASQSLGNNSYGGGDNSAALAEIERNKQLTQQAISTLQGYAPKISEVYAGKQSYLESQKDPTKARYDALIAEIKNKESMAQDDTTYALNSEMGRRGISNQSGYSEQQMALARNKVGQQYTGYLTETGLARENDLKAITDAIKLLALEESQAQMQLGGQISAAQLGGGANALSAANILYGNSQAQAQLAAQQAQAQSEQNYNNQVLALKQAESPLQLQLLQAQINAYNRKGGTLPTLPTNPYSDWGT